MDIQAEAGGFLPLERLVAHITSDSKIALSKNAPTDMRLIKQVGDTAAHDRNYITQKADLDDLMPKLRRLLVELMALVGPD